MSRVLTYSLCFVLVMASLASANDGGTRSPFDFGAGARDLSSGAANIATCDMTTAPFWNASRLIYAEKLSFSGFHSRLYDSDVAYQYFGAAIPTLDWGSLGVGVFRLGIDGIEKRDVNNMLLGSTDDNRLALFIAYARVMSGFDFGIAAMMENHSLDGYSTTSSPGINLSVGKTISFNHARIKEMSFALNGRNLIRPSIKLAEQKTKYPYAVDFGASISACPVLKWDNILTLSASLSKVDFLDPTLSIGLEYEFQKMFHLNGGVRDKKLSVGGGISYGLLTFDYALVERDLGSLHLFNISAVFGRAISEKRKLRTERQEMEFNSLMNQKLTTRNMQMVQDIIEKGQKQLNQDNLASASNYFEKALFLARNNDIDTTQIYQLVEDTRLRLVAANNEQLFGQYLDSTRVKLESRDFLAAKYFANLALSINSNSDEASDYLKKANKAVNAIASREEVIKQRLLEIDSLITYGQSDQAAIAAKALSAFAPNDERVRLAVRKAEFEHWRGIASDAYAIRDFVRANVALDTALTLFPAHQWCLEMQKRIKIDMNKAAAVSIPVKAAVIEPLSPDLRKEVEESYKAAQSLFERGNLSEAVQHWERVERLSPGYQWVREYLIKAYKFIGIELYGNNRLQEAIATWEKAVHLDPGNDEINDYIKRTNNEIKKMEELTYDHK